MGGATQTVVPEAILGGGDVIHIEVVPVNATTGEIIVQICVREP